MKITLKHLPFISLLSNFFHNPVRQTVSNAFRKSTNVQNIFFQTKCSSISACKTNILSWVEYSLRKPVWFPEIIPSSLEKILSLVQMYLKWTTNKGNSTKVIRIGRTSLVFKNWFYDTTSPIFRNNTRIQHNVE